MTDAEQRQDLFSKYQATLFERQASNAKDFDGAILTYSAAGLGLSIGFLKDFVPIAVANVPWLLYWSWGSFAGAIIVTVASYQISQLALSKAHRIGERYYIEREEEAFAERKKWSNVVDAVALLAGVLFLGAVICTAIFVAKNVERASAMKWINNGATVPDLQKGMPVPFLQTVPQTQPAQQSEGGGK